MGNFNQNELAVSIARFCECAESHPDARVNPYFETVTRRNVAGIEVASPVRLSFCALKSASSSAYSSASLPVPAADSKAFIVGP